MRTKGLTIGQRIRMTRKYLGVKQYEITSGKITRNLISAIENDKVRLTAENARLIYDNLNRFAKERNLEIDLDLSEVLGDEPEFIAEIQADQYLNQLRRFIKNHEPPSVERLVEIEDFLYSWNIPIKKADIYTLFGDIYRMKSDNLKQLFYYTKAFELYSVEKYINSLPKLATKICECAVALNSPEIGVRFCELAISKDPATYREEMYELYMMNALTHSDLGNHDKALKSIDMCIDRYTDDLGPEYYQAVSTKAECHEKAGEHRDAVQYYTHASNGFFRLGCVREGVESLVQMIILMHQTDSRNYDDLIRSSLEELEEKMKLLQSVHFPLKLKLADMYTYAKENDSAFKYYHSIFNSEEALSELDAVRVLHKSYDLFADSDQTEAWTDFYMNAQINPKTLDAQHARLLATSLSRMMVKFMEKQDFDAAVRITHDLASLA